MKILVDINHPAHVHLFKNLIWELESSEHEVLVTSREKDLTLNLLNHYGFDHITISSSGDSLVGLGKEFMIKTLRLLKIAKSFKPDLYLGLNPSISIVSKIAGGKSIAFTDTEHYTFKNKITFSFSDLICTPDCYKDDIGPKQVRYPGYHELAYLHPNRFEPDPSVLDYIDADKDDKIVILRLISWKAAHDVGHHGLDNVVDVVNKLESTDARVVITSEGDIPKEIEYCQSKVPPHKIHDLMYYSNLYIGESGTMATESAILGTPSIRVSSVAKLLGNTHELSDKYELLYYYENEQKALEKGLDFLKKNSKENWKQKRDKMLEDKIDVTDFIVWLIEKYPESHNILKQKSDYQKFLKENF